MAKKLTMTKEEAAEECRRASGIMEDVMMGLWPDGIPAPEKNAIADKLSETKDVLDELQSDLQDDARAAKTPAQLRHEEGCWASPDGTIPQKKKAKAGK